LEIKSNPQTGIRFPLKLEEKSLDFFGQIPSTVMFLAINGGHLSTFINDNDHPRCLMMFNGV
jgi:hypothetical protein